MTWSLKLAGLPRAGANSKPHDCKEKVQKVKDLPKTWVSSKNRLQISDQKIKKSSHGIENRTKEPQDPKGKN